MTDEMKLWNKFEKTDPAHTKKVSLGRTFTSIDAHWQVKRVTEVLGPVGQGWGYDVYHQLEHLQGIAVVAIADVTIWWKDQDDARYSYGPFRGCEVMVEYKDGQPKTSPKGIAMVDDDAPKKAMTDALTKGLSHMGVSADVFLGLFDDNKYVQRVTREFEAEKAAVSTLPESVTIALNAIAKAESHDDLDKAIENSLEARKTWDQIHKDLYMIRGRQRRRELPVREPELVKP